MRSLLKGKPPADSHLLVFEFVVVKRRCQETGARKGNCYAGGVDGYPPPSPLFRNVSRGAATTRRIEDNVARVGAHQDATLDSSGVCLHHINLIYFR